MLLEKPLSGEWLQIKEEVDKAAERERNGRPPFFESTISLARRPLITSRFILLGLLDDLTPEEARKALGLGRDKAPYWHNPPKEIKERFRDMVILDPFAGGGSIPLEAIRLGAKAIAVEYSPVQWAALKFIEVAQKHPNLINLKAWERLKKKYRRGFGADMEAICNDPSHVEVGPLVAEGCRVVKETKAELEKYYPPYNGKRVSHYIWVKQVKCPKCGVWVPLVLSFGLSTRDKVYWDIEYNGNDYVVKIKRGEEREGTIRGGEAQCPRCRVSIPNEYIRKHIKGNDRLVVIRTEDSEYYPADVEQIKAYDLVPEPERLEEEVPPNDPRNVIPPIYGYTKFGDLFNKRQHLVLNTLVRKISALQPELKTILAWLLAKHADYNSTFTVWHKSGEKVSHTLSHKVLTMSWDYVEVNPFARGSGSLWGNLFDIIDGLAFLVEALGDSGSLEVVFGSATNLPYPDKSTRYVVTDPPYYDNVPYPEVYDFVYVWLKRVLGDVYPEQFRFWTLWRDRSAEDISVGGSRTKEHFDLLIERAFREIRRVLTDDGALVMYFAHSRREAWISIMSALHKAGFAVVNVFPVSTESKTDIQGQGKVSQLSSIIVVARPVAEGTAYVEKIKEKIEEAVKSAVATAWEEGYRGSDLLMVAYSAALREATRFSQLKSLKGDPIKSVIEFAEEVAVRTVNEILFKAPVDRVTAFYVYAVNSFGGVLDSDTYLLLTRLTAGREELERLGLARKQKSRVEVADFVDRCDKAGRGAWLVDVVHRLLCAFRDGGKDKVEQILQNANIRFSLEEICRAIDAIYGRGWGKNSEVVRNFTLVFCGKRIKGGLTQFMYEA